MWSVGGSVESKDSSGTGEEELFLEALEIELELELFKVSVFPAGQYWLLVNQESSGTFVRLLWSYTAVTDDNANKMRSRQFSNIENPR
jgi:hypothetical protein